jgi:hypothetical protein
MQLFSQFHSNYTHLGLTKGYSVRNPNEMSQKIKNSCNTVRMALSSAGFPLLARSTDLVNYNQKRRTTVVSCTSFISLMCCLYILKPSVL